MLSILRYGNEVRPAEPYFEGIAAETKPEAVALATELIKRMTGRFEPEKMPDEYARAVKELIQAKIEQRAPTNRDDWLGRTAGYPKNGRVKLMLQRAARWPG